MLVKKGIFQIFNAKAYIFLNILFYRIIFNKKSGEFDTLVE